MSATEELRRLLDERGVEHAGLRGQGRPVESAALLPELRREGGGRMTHEERVYHHLYETNEGIREQSERIASLEELVCFIMHQCNDGNPRCDECIGWNGGECVALQRMHELGIEVD